MTRKMTGLIAAGSLAIGIAVGAAGTTVARDDAAPDMADHMRGMASMMSMMGAGAMDGMGSMMGAGHMADMMGADHMADMADMMGADHTADMASMMSMMGAGSPMTPNASMGPGASMSLDDHASHHASPSPEPTR